MGSVSNVYWAIVAMVLFGVAAWLPFIVALEVERVTVARKAMKPRAYALSLGLVVAEAALVFVVIGSILWLIWSARLGV